MTQLTPSPVQAPLALTAQPLRRLRLCFDQIVLATATRCARNGALDGKLLDRHQFASYEIALAAADLLAAENLLAVEHAHALDRGLALVFIADTIQSLLSRLDALALEIGLPAEEVRAIACSDAWATLRRQANTGEVMAAVGRAVTDTDAEIAAIRLDPETAMAQDAFVRFAADAVAPQAERIHREDLTVPETLLQPMRDMGVFGLSIPETYGGSATGSKDDTLMMIAVTEALSEASLAAAGSLITRPEILARALMTGGTEAQKRHWLPRIAAGNPLCSIAITEPDYGSDVASLMLAGTRTEGGWLLNGAKTWCTFAGKAGVLMVVTRTERDRSAGHRGLSLLLVEKPSFEGHAFEHQQPAGGGRLRGRAIPTIGYRGMHSFDLSFENYFVPDANVIGEQAGLGKGFYYTMAGMTGGRMQTAARACGVMRAALKAAVRYARDRRVFGAPLGEYALTQVKIARMAARFAACRQLAYAIGRRLEDEGPSMEASLVKLLACRSAEGVTREALQIHGGMGYAEESPVSRYFVDARVLSIFEGAEETLALKVVAKSLFENALAAQARIVKAVAA